MSLNCPGCGGLLSEGGADRCKAAKCPWCGHVAAAPTPVVGSSEKVSAVAGDGDRFAPNPEQSRNTVVIDLWQAKSATPAGEDHSEPKDSGLATGRDRRSKAVRGKNAVAAVAGILLAEGSGKYRLGEVVAEGGMGAIIDAWDSKLRRHIAMKILLKPREADKEQIFRFIEEAQITSQLEHPSVVPVHELAVNEDGDVYYTMKLLQGKTLKEIIEDIRRGDSGTIRAYPLSHLLSIFQKVCDAVAFAHSKCVVHRDLKPDNIMVGAYGEVQVMDWGLAKVTHRAADGEVATDQAAAAAVESAGKAMDATEDRVKSACRNAGMDMLKTMDGCIIGTPRYMSPEQAMGNLAHMDERSDIYALGAVLYAILTLQPPVDGSDVQDVLAKVKAGQITPPTEVTVGKPLGGSTFSGILPFDKECQADGPDGDMPPVLRHLPNNSVPASLSAVAMKAMALSPDSRYRDVKELQKEIDAYQNGFATGAEQAGIWRQLLLFVKRHKGASLATAIGVWR